MSVTQLAGVNRPFAPLNALLQQLYAQEQLPSLSAVIVHRQTMIWHESCGYADLTEKRVADAQTIYGLGSITKIFTALMLMQLREAGQLQLDEPVAHYLPELKQLAKGTSITFRQLASHTAGLPMMPPLPELAQAMQEFPPNLATLRQIRFPTGARLLELLPVVDLIAPPGTQVAYANLGVALLAQALERIADQGYTDYITEHLLQPLGMMHSSFSSDKLPATHLATSYLPFTEPPMAAPPEMKAIQGFTPAGGLSAAVSDMVRFLCFLADGQGSLAQPILSRQRLQEMMQPVAHLPASHYTNQPGASGVGIGWFLTTCQGQRMIEHGGADPSSAAYLAYLPDQELGVFVATNTGSNPLAVVLLANQLLAQVLPLLE